MSVKASSVAKNERVSVDFIALGKDNVESNRGFYFNGGKISCMPALVKFEPTTNVSDCVKMVYNSYNDRIMFYLSNGSVKMWDDVNNSFTTLQGNGVSPPQLIDCYYDNNHYLALLCGNKIHKFEADGTVNSGTYLSDIYCCTYHHGRLFEHATVDGDEFFWSEQGMKGYSATTIGKAGFFKVPKGAGPIKRMFSLGDRIVVLRDYGIIVMRGLADTRNFTLEPGTLMLGEQLIENTALCVGKKVWFCTKHYIYCFDGSTLTQREHPYGDDKTNIVSMDAIDARYLYLSMTVGTSRQLVRYDPLSDEFVNFAYNCRFICNTPRGLYAIYASNVIAHLSADGYSGNSLKFKSIDFDNDKYKTLKSIYLKAEAGIKLNLKFKDSSHSFSNGEYHNLNLTSRDFDFSLSGCGEVYGLKAVWEVYK